MQIKEQTTIEINRKLEEMSSAFSKIDYLEQCVKERQDITIKKFCNLKLSLLYLGRGMYGNAAKNMSAVARLAQTYGEKVNAYKEEVRILIKGFKLQQAEDVFTKALSFANKYQRIELKKELMELFKEKAKQLEAELKPAKAMKVYEYLYKLGDEVDKKAFREKLLHFYKKLGMIKEYNMLR